MPKKNKWNMKLFQDGTPTYRKINVIGSFLLILVIAVVLMISQSSAVKARNLIEERDVLIETLQEEIDELSKEKVEEDIGEARKALNSASADGKMVAALQTKFGSLVREENTEEALEISNEIADYLAPENQDAKVLWFTTGVEHAAGEWEFANNYAFFADKLPVVWTYRIKGEPEILAYALGEYNAKTGLFEDIHWEITSFGNRFIDTTDSGMTSLGESGDSVTGIENLMDDIRETEEEMFGDYERENLSEEEWDDLSGARWGTEDDDED